MRGQHDPIAITLFLWLTPENFLLRTRLSESEDLEKGQHQFIIQMTEWITKLSGYLARILSALIVFISIGIGLSKVSGHAINVPIEAWFGYLFSVLAFLMTYIFSRIEKIKETQDIIMHKDFPGLEVFGSSDDLLKRIHTTRQIFLARGA
jgi:hypothetical protein